MAQGLHHGVVDADRGKAQTPRALHNRAVEVAVVNHDSDVSLHQLFGQLRGHPHPGQRDVVDLRGLVVHRPRHQQDLCVGGVGVGAVRDWGLGVGLQVQVQRGHWLLAVRIASISSFKPSLRDSDW